MIATTRLNSKGQVLIPARVRRALGWRPGAQLTVEIRPAGEHALMLRERSADDVEAMLSRGYEWFEHRDPDLVEALHECRRNARVRERRRC